MSEYYLHDGMFWWWVVIGDVTSDVTIGIGVVVSRTVGPDVECIVVCGTVGFDGKAVVVSLCEWTVAVGAVLLALHFSPLQQYPEMLKLRLPKPLLGETWSLTHSCFSQNIKNYTFDWNIYIQQF